MPKKIDHQKYADETIKLINNFKEEDNKKLAVENIRALYRETSAYSLHYSNIRSALAVLFIGGAIAFLPEIFTHPTLKCLELIFLIIGFLAHIVLTRNAQSALMH